MKKWLSCVLIFALLFAFSPTTCHAKTAPAVVHAVIFDMDGVLVDSEYLHFIAWNTALATWNRSFAVEEYPSYAGHSGDYIAAKLAALYGIPSHEALLAKKRMQYSELQKNGIPPMIEAVAFVRELHAKKAQLGIKLGLASAAGKEEILATLRYIGLDAVFDVVVSGKDDLTHIKDPEGTNKPKPYVYLEAARRLGVPPEACIAFEDSGPGVQAARNAGIYTYAVPNVYTRYHDFSRANEVLHSGFLQFSLERIVKP